MDPAIPPSDAAAELLEQVLTPLLADFQDSFQRGLMLLEHCPDRVLDPARRQELGNRLGEGLAALAAARLLRGSTPAPMALDMVTINRWHQLVVEVWSLSGALRAAGAHPSGGPADPPTASA